MSKALTIRPSREQRQKLELYALEKDLSLNEASLKLIDSAITEDYLQVAKILSC